MTQHTEPFESDSAPAAPRRKCRSALAQSILKQHPDQAHKSDAQLVLAHHRALFLRESTKAAEWAASQVQNRSRDEVYASRVESLRAWSVRNATLDLRQVGIEFDRAAEIAESIISDQHVYEAAMAALAPESQELFT